MTTQPENHAADSPTTEGQKALRKWREQKAASERPHRWIQDVEFYELQSRVHRQGERLVLLALRQHDLDEDNPWGAYPGYERIAALTGLSSSYVRRVLGDLTRNGYIAKKKRGRFTHYYLVPPDPDEDFEADDRASEPDSPRPPDVSDVFPLEGHSKGIRKGDVIPKGITDRKGMTEGRPEGSNSVPPDTELPNVRHDVGAGSRSASGDGDRSPTPGVSRGTRRFSGDDTNQGSAAPQRDPQAPKWPERNLPPDHPCVRGRSQ